MTPCWDFGFRTKWSGRLGTRLGGHPPHAPQGRPSQIQSSIDDHPFTPHQKRMLEKVSKARALSNYCFAHGKNAADKVWMAACIAVCVCVCLHDRRTKRWECPGPLRVPFGLTATYSWDFYVQGHALCQSEARWSSGHLRPTVLPSGFVDYTKHCQS